MPESTRPLLKNGHVTIGTAGAAQTEYVTLLEVECAPNNTLYVRDIYIEQSVTTGNCLYNMSINGKPYIKDAPLFGGSGGFSFGGDLVLTKVKKPILIQVKSTAVGIVTISAWITGIEVQK